MFFSYFMILETTLRARKVSRFYFEHISFLVVRIRIGERNLEKRYFYKHVRRCTWLAEGALYTLYSCIRSSLFEGEVILLINRQWRLYIRHAIANSILMSQQIFEWDIFPTFLFFVQHFLMRVTNIFLVELHSLILHYQPHLVCYIICAFIFLVLFDFI